MSTTPIYKLEEDEETRQRTHDYYVDQLERLKAGVLGEATDLMQVKEKKVELLQKIRATKDIGSWVRYLAELPSVGHEQRGNRVKRQWVIGGILAGMGIVALGSWLFGPKELASIAVDTSADPTTIRLLQEHETRVTVNERSIKLLEQTVKKYQGELKSAYAETQAAFALLLVFQEASKEFDRVLSGMAKLSTHRLAPELVKMDFLRKVLTEMAGHARAKQLKLITEDVADLFYMDTSHLCFANGTIRIIVHVPVYQERSMLEVYEYIRAPMQLPDSEKYIQPEPSRPILAVSKDKTLYREVTKDDLQLCRKIRQYYWCDNENHYRPANKGSCLFSLFRAKPGEIRENCKFSVGPQGDSLVQLDADEFVLYQSEYGTLDRYCDGQKTSRNFRGLVRVRLAAGCRAVTSQYVFDGSYSLTSGIHPISSMAINMSALLHLDLKHKVKTLDNLGLLRLVGSKQGLNIKDIESLYKTQTALYHISWGLAVTFVIIIVSICCICYLRCRHFRKRAAQDEESVFARFFRFPWFRQDREMVEMGPDGRPLPRSSVEGYYQVRRNRNFRPPGHSIIRGGRYGRADVSEEEMEHMRQLDERVQNHPMPRGGFE